MRARALVQAVISDEGAMSVDDTATIAGRRLSASSVDTRSGTPVIVLPTGRSMPGSTHSSMEGTVIGDVSPAVALDAAAAAMAEVEPVVEHVTVKSEVWGAFDDDMGQRYY